MMLNFCLRPPHNFPTVTVHAQRLNLQNQCLHLQQDSGLSWQNQKDWREYLGVCVHINEWVHVKTLERLWCLCIFECLYVHAFYLFSHQALEYLPFEGTVSLKSPQHIFCLLEDYGTDPNNIPEQPFYVYFGRWVRYAWLLAYVWLTRGDLHLNAFLLYIRSRMDSVNWFAPTVWRTDTS